MKEYAFLVQSCEVPLTSTETSAAERGHLIAEKLVAMTETLRLGLRSFDHGGWYVLSHDVLESHGSVIVSFLICREQKDAI